MFENKPQRDEASAPNLSRRAFLCGAAACAVVTMSGSASHAALASGPDEFVIGIDPHCRELAEEPVRLALAQALHDAGCSLAGYAVDDSARLDHARIERMLDDAGYHRAVDGTRLRLTMRLSAGEVRMSGAATGLISVLDRIGIIVDVRHGDRRSNLVLNRADREASASGGRPEVMSRQRSF